MYEPGEVQVALEDGMSIVRLLGEHDLATDQLLAARLGDLIATGNPLVVDVSGAKFIDSTVIRAVMDARATRKVPVAIVVPESAPAAVARLIKVIADIAPDVPVARTPAEAKKLIASE